MLRQAGVDVLAFVIGWLGLVLVLAVTLIAWSWLRRLTLRARLRAMRRRARRHHGPRIAGVGIPQDPAKPIILLVERDLGAGDDGAAPRH